MGVRHRHFLLHIRIETITNMSDREFVAGTEPAHLHPLPVDPDPVRASEITDHHFAMVGSHATVVARDPQRIESRVALGMTAHDHHGPIQRNVGTFV
jgi:hypothetical protein